MLPGLVRGLLGDAIAIVMLALYGGEVCPMIEGLGFRGALRDLVLAFGLAQVLSVFAARSAGGEPSRWPINAARLVFYRYLGVGLGLGAYNDLVRDFDTPSAFKLLLGCVTMGLVAAHDARLYAESRLLDKVERGEVPSLVLERTASRVSEITAMAILMLGLFTVDMLLVVRKDLEDLSFLTMDALPAAVDAVGRELLFVGGVLVVCAVHLITSAGRNLRRLFENQTQVLAQVEGGSLERHVPVASSDEFGLIAAQTNRMIDALRERRRLREIFGKIVSPQVAARLLAPDQRGLGPSSRRTLTVLFTDIRGFTSWAERAEPEALVADLNQYFGVLVEIVHRHGGVVDKFIGDGLMAVFGLDDGQDAPAQAVRAAREMLAAMPALRAQLGHDLRMSVGVHTGEVISGAIGASDRLEFTVVGDAVNTAARVESLTRELGVDLLVTEAVWRAIGEPAGWRPLGQRAVRGRQETVALYTPA